MYKVLDSKGIAYINGEGDFRRFPEGHIIRQVDIDKQHITIGGLKQLEIEGRVELLDKNVIDDVDVEIEGLKKDELLEKAREAGLSDKDLNPDGKPIRTRALKDLLKDKLLRISSTK